ncbi:MAG: DUF3157 family protein [Fibrobacter sp.]|nr:DUF3157 family protein [Fibrobacter sp.]
MKNGLISGMIGVLLCLYLNVSANDMILTLDDGRKAILHEDKTWGFQEFSIADGDEEDIYISLDNGKTICLKTDNTWDYTKGQPPQKKTAMQLPSIFANGSATKPSLDMAVQAATQMAITKAADRLMPYAKKSKLTHKYLEACIKNEIGSSGAEVSYKPGWTAQAKVSLDNIQVKNIIDCVTIQIDQSTTAKDTSKAAATPQ